MNCATCGQANPPEATFCGGCAEPLTGEDARRARGRRGLARRHRAVPGPAASQQIRRARRLAGLKQARLSRRWAAGTAPSASLNCLRATRGNSRRPAGERGRLASQGGGGQASVRGAGVRVGILELLTPEAPLAWWQMPNAYLIIRQYASIMPQAVSVWCRSLGHEVFYATYFGQRDPKALLPAYAGLLSREDRMPLLTDGARPLEDPGRAPADHPAALPFVSAGLMGKEGSP